MLIVATFDYSRRSRAGKKKKKKKSDYTEATVSLKTEIHPDLAEEEAADLSVNIY